MNKFNKIAFFILIFVTSCTTTNLSTVPSSSAPPPSAPNFLLLGMCAIVPPYLSIVNAHTGERIDAEDLSDFSKRLQITTHALFVEKGVRLTSIENCIEHWERNDFRHTMDPFLQGKMNLEQLHPPDVFTCIDYAELDLIVFVDMKALYTSRRGRSMVPIWGTDGRRFYFERIHPRDKYSVIIDVRIVDLKNRKVVWENRIFKKANIESETILTNLLTELLDPIQGKVRY
ncbi:MAG: hypothetical protein FJ241_07205 [Nitrospira sp.]|nr:hypothetical protein [Nitrospira sp.]